MCVLRGHRDLERPRAMRGFSGRVITQVRVEGSRGRAPRQGGCHAKARRWTSMWGFRDCQGRWGARLMRESMAREKARICAGALRCQQTLQNFSPDDLFLGFPASKRNRLWVSNSAHLFVLNCMVLVFSLTSHLDTVCHKCVLSHLQLS